MLKVEIYSKPNCHLCEHAKEILQRLQLESPFILQETNIEANEKYLEFYKEKIPVILLDGELIFYGRISEKALRKKILERME